MKKWRVTVLIISLITIQNGIAQTGSLSAVKASLNIGLDAVNNHGLEQSFDVVSYSEFSNRQLNVGFEGGVFFSRWYFGGIGNIGFGSSYTVNEDKTSASSGHAMVTAGYQVLKGNSFIVYPTLGIGIGGSLLSSESGSEINSYYMKNGIMLNTDLFLRPGNEAGGIVLGLSMGYQWNMFDSGWSGDQEGNIYFRDYNPKGFVVAMKIGWGVMK